MKIRDLSVVTPNPGELFDKSVSSPRRRVGDKQMRDPLVLDPGHDLGGVRDRLFGVIENAVEIEEYAADA